MPLLLAILIWGICAAIAIPFFTRTWWMPQAISAHARTVDDQIVLTTIITGIVFILAHLALGYTVLFYGKRRAGAATYSHGNTTYELLWSSAAGILFIGLTLMGTKVWGAIHFQPAPPGALQIELTGQQFAWNVRYSGPDGKFGALDIKQINDQSGNPLGVDAKDPNGKDDITAPTMPVPVNRPIEVILRTKDVTHAFNVPELRLKLDTVPGLLGRLHFTADKTGVFELACAELCGLGHYKMRSFLEVMEPAKFDAWIQEKLKEKSAP